MSAVSTFAFSLFAFYVWITASVSAHVVVDQVTAPAGVNTFLSFRVLHGCNGSPTIGLRILLPPGVDYVVPQYKSGWKFSTQVPNPDENQTEIFWSGGSIPPDMYDRFEIETRLMGDINSVLHFKAVQDCKQGEIRYVDIPEQRSLPWETPDPAPSLRLVSPD